jgi:hypothetical protein
MRSELNLCEKARGQSKPRQKLVNTLDKYENGSQKPRHHSWIILERVWSVSAHSVQSIHVFCFLGGSSIQFSVSGGMVSFSSFRTIN